MAGHITSCVADTTGDDVDCDAPARLTTGEVCQIARFSRATLWRRVAAGRLPEPIDHARQALFCAKDVMSALRQGKSAKATALDVAIAQRLARMHAKYRLSA